MKIHNLCWVFLALAHTVNADVFGAMPPEETAPAEEAPLDEAPEGEDGLPLEGEGTEGTEGVEEEIGFSVTLEVWSAPRDDWSNNNGPRSSSPNGKLFGILEQVHSTLLGTHLLGLDMNQVIYNGCPIKDEKGVTLAAIKRQEICENDCVNGQNFCELPPTDEYHPSTTGKELLGETLRRICVWQLAQEEDNPGLFLDYLFHFQEAKCDTHNFGRTCLNQVYELSEIDETKIVACAREGGGFKGPDNSILRQALAKEQEKEFYDALEKRTEKFPKVFMNGKLLEGEVLENPAALLTAVCESVPPEERPEECDTELTLPVEAILAEALDTYQQDIATAAGTTYRAPTGEESKTVVDLWTTPLLDWNVDDVGNGPNKNLFQRFQKIQYDFQDTIVLRPRHYVYSKVQVCPSKYEDGTPRPPEEQDMCADKQCTNGHRYCHHAPRNWMVTGTTMVEETLRRACLWEMAPKDVYFDYWVFFHKNNCDNEDIKEECMTQAFEHIGIDAGEIQNCMDQSGGLTEDAINTILEDTIKIQNATFPYLELEVEDLPLVLVDGELAASTETVDLYQLICRKMDESGAVTHSICRKDLVAYVDTFDVSAKEIFDREQQFEHAIAVPANVEETIIAPEHEGPVIEVWTTPTLDIKPGTKSEDGINIDLFAKMKELVVGFGSDIVFRPQWYLSSPDEVCSLDRTTGVELSKEQVDACKDADCYSAQGELFCSFPDKGLGVSGKQILEEGLRRSCVFHMHGRNGKGGDSDLVFFEYLQKFHDDHCLAPGGINSITELVDSIEVVNKYDLRKCQRGSKDILTEMLNIERAKFYYHQLDPSNLPIVLINGVPVEEGVDLSVDELFQVVCDQFPEDKQPDVCLGSLEENLGEDFNITVAPSDIVEELEGDAFGTELNMTLMTHAPTEMVGDGIELGFGGEEAATTVAPTTEIPETIATVPPTTEVPETIATVPPTTEVPETIATVAPTTETPEIVLTVPPTTEAPEIIATVAPTTEAPEVVLTAAPTTEVPEIIATVPPTTETPEVIATVAPTTEAPVITDPPLAATTAPVIASGTSPPATGAPIDSVPLDETAAEAEDETIDEIGEEIQEELNDITSEKALEVKGVAVEKTPTPVVAERTSGDITTNTELKAEDELDAVLDIEATPLGEVENLEELDMTLVTSAIEHIEALQKCDVDTKVLIKKLMALGAGGDVLRQEVSSIQTELPLFMSETCPPEEGEEIMTRMHEFQQCSMYNLQELIETFPSTAMGVAMRCANAYSEMTPKEAASGFVPEACIRTIEAGGPLGRALFGLYLYPDVSCPCFEKLGHHIPECTADVWPIPINGVLVKTQSCLVGEYCQSIDVQCEKNLEIFNQCLQTEDVKGRDIACGQVFDACSEIYENVPPFLNSAPLPDACIRIAEGSKFYGQHIVERYDAFRHECGQNLELWEGHTPIAEFKAFLTDGIAGVNPYGFDFISGASGGFFAGIAFCIIFIIVRNICRCICKCLKKCCCCCKKKKNARPSTKDYGTVDTNGDDTTEYKD